MIKTPLSIALGGAFWTPSATIIGSSSKNLTQLIKSIFANGEQGFAYDPNDLTTLYQDAAGTIPVTAAGQPVGLMKDKSGRNNHAFQTVSASRPILQQTPNQFGLEIWNPLTGVYGEASRLSSNVFRIYSSTGVDSGAVSSNAYTSGKYYKVTFNITSVAAEGGGLRLGSSGAVVPAIVGSYSGYYTADSPQFAIHRAAGATDITISDVSVKEVTGYRTDQNYLKFDGVDDFLKTNNIDFTATDKISLFAGVKSLNANTLYPTIAMFTPNPSWFNNNGTFVLAQSKTPSSYNVGSRGTVTASVTTSSTFPTPNSSVLTMTTRISTPLLALRVNSVLAASISTNQGSGNYGNYPLFIGRDGESGSYPFSGHIYSLVGIGRLATDAATIALEKSIAKNIGVTLNV